MSWLEREGKDGRLGLGRKSMEKGEKHDTLQLKSLLPAPILADCLFIAGLTLGTELHSDDLLVVDKR